MNRFEHIDADSLKDAASLVSQDHDAQFIAGGTDLLTRVKLGIISPGRIINLKTVPDIDAINEDGSGITIGAMATLDDISRNSTIREKYPALFMAISAAASPQLRNTGTIGGNLMQGPRCWYYRGTFRCWLKGGDMCYAANGENSHHAIFAGGPCNAVHPSDTAPALASLGAEVHVYGPTGERAVPVEDMFQLPREGSRRMTALAPDEIITRIRIPAPEPGSRSTYLKAMERKVWAFALASVAASLVIEDSAVRQASVVLGGVAARPWRAMETENVLRDQALTPELIDRASEAAVSGAKPLAHNGYKMALLRGIVREALAGFLP